VLSAKSSYEVRVSYLGFDAAAFRIEWEPCNTKQSQRFLLDTEKIVFSTDDKKAISGNPCENYVISVRAVRESRGISKAVEQREIHYNLAFERYGKHVAVPKSILIILVLIGTFVPGSLLVYFTIVYSSKQNQNVQPDGHDHNN
jgi:hypothetical protein